MQDEDGDWYFAVGHWSQVRFVFAVMLDLGQNVGGEEALAFVGLDGQPFRRDKDRLNEAIEAVEHVWFRYDDPNNDESMALCGADDEGAMAFTRIRL